MNTFYAYAFQPRLGQRVILGYTLDYSGVNLPKNFGPWKPLGQRELRDDAVKIKATMVADGIRRDGYYLVSFGATEIIVRDNQDNTGEMIADRAGN